MKLRKRLIFVLLFLSLSSASLWAQDEAALSTDEPKKTKIKNKRRVKIDKTEIGFWLGASSPLPGSDVHGLFDTALGFGLFTRFLWPFNSLYTELGVSYTSYLSNTERRLITVPTYAALAYELPFDLPISFFLKAGGGAAYVTARPANVYGWDPMLYAGFEASFVAGRKVRIGLRLDYNQIMESWQEQPDRTKWLYLSPYSDARLYNPNQYKKVDAEFFHFALMLSVFL